MLEQLKIMMTEVLSKHVFQNKKKLSFFLNELSFCCRFRDLLANFYSINCISNRSNSYSNVFVAPFYHKIISIVQRENVKRQCI